MQRHPQIPAKSPVTGSFRLGPQKIGYPQISGSGSRVLVWLLLLPVLIGCASSGDNQNTPTGGEEEAYVPLPVRKSEVGTLMLELDKTLKAWQQAVVTNNSVMLRRMESILRNRVNDSFDLVIQGLESPAPALRQTAATALGFSGHEQALSPLASALHDPDDRVVANALVGLGQLASPLSPVSVIAYRLRTSTDQTVRSNAAYALVRIALSEGARDFDSLEACRQGLYDDFPAVRGHCASFLGIVQDTQSVPDLASLLLDEVDLVAKPSLLALGAIARGEPRSLGEVARALVAAMGKVERSRRAWVRTELTRIAERDYENDINAWTEWAYSLP